MEHQDEDALRRAQAELRDGRPLGPELNAAVGRVLGRIRPTVLRICKGMLRNDATAEEVTQAALAIAWEKLAAFAWDGSFDGYVCGIARNLCRSRFRKFTEILSDDGVVELASNDLGALAALREEEREALFDEVYRQLPMADRAVLDLYRAGLSYAEIDARLRLSGSGARGALMKARRHLREAIRAALDKRGHGSSFFWTTVP